MTQAAVQPLSPARRDDPLAVGSTRPLRYNVKNPFDRQKIMNDHTGEHVFFDGNILNITFNNEKPRRPEETQALEGQIGDVVQGVLIEAFGQKEEEAPDLKVTVSSQGDSLVINARPEEENEEENEIFSQPPLAPNVARSGVKNPDVIPFEAGDAITLRPREGIDLTDKDFSLVEPAAPVAVIASSDPLFEANLRAADGANGGGGGRSGAPSANLVEATVVEDLDYARRVRDSEVTGKSGEGVGSGGGGSRKLGAATIISTALGALALLVFALLALMALARRRRRSYNTTTTSSGTPPTSLTAPTPTHSGTPLMTTPSVSDAAYLEDAATTANGSSGPASLEIPPPMAAAAAASGGPVMPLDGHQTIVSTYEDYMSATPVKSIVPSPPDSLSVPLTKNLADSDEYLFARK